MLKNSHTFLLKKTDLLINQGKETLLLWVRQVLLEACYAKLNSSSLYTPKGDILEPVPFHYNAIHQSVPLVAWNKQQEWGLQSEIFLMLLHKLGFHLATDVGKLFPRIPYFWSADHLYQLAQKLDRNLSSRTDLKMDLNSKYVLGAAENMEVESLAAGVENDRIENIDGGYGAVAIIAVKNEANSLGCFMMNPEAAAGVMRGVSSNGIAPGALGQFAL